ncbi:MAG TPA: hypothetical protein VN450_04935 [Candidatus Methylomirabilis sp.]|nr:hypothetical protein [Candidatus Methylomirabilis sp.]
MGSSPTVKRFLVFAGFFLPMAFLFLLLLSGSPPVARAADYTVTGGIVERVSGTVVTLERNSYDVEKARVVSPSGKVIPFTEIARGKKVDLFLSRNNKITTVVVYPSMVE